MASSRTLLSMMTVVTLGAALWWVTSGPSDGPAAPQPPAKRSAKLPPPSTPPTEPPAGPATAPRFGSEEGRRARAQMLDRILRNLGPGAATPGAKPPDPVPGEPTEDSDGRSAEQVPSTPRIEGTLPADYVREVIREEFIPLAHDCFDLVLEDDPKFEGKTVVRFTIVGDEGIGGVVESAEEVEGASTLPPEMGECLVESMMSLTFDAPGEGRGRTVVTFPFMFFGE